MHRITRIIVAVLGVAVGLVFLKEMLAHYGGNGGVGGGWLHPSPLPAALAPTAQRPELDSLTVALRPRAGEVDTVFTADITIANRRGSPVRDVVLGCDALGDDGSATGHVAVTLTQVFPARAATTAANVSLPFIHRPDAVRCAITNYSIGH